MGTVAGVAVVVLPLGVWLVPGMAEMGVGLRNAPFAYEPFVPSGESPRRDGRALWWGRLPARLYHCSNSASSPDSFEGEDLIDEEIDLSEDIPPLKHPRKVVLKECFFIAFPMLGMLIGSYLATRVVTEPPMGLEAGGWYGVLGGVVLGFLVGGGSIWSIRILGTLGFGKEAMGMGDIHLLAAIGAVIGWWESIYMCIFIAPFLGIAVVIAFSGFSAITKKENRQIPYGPIPRSGGGAAHVSLATGVSMLWES